MNHIEQLKQQFQLEPHPEGGSYKRNYQSEVLLPTDRGLRHAMSTISYLLEADEFSAFHRIQSDETWAYHEGSSALVIYELTDTGLKQTRLGRDHPLLTVPAKTWFAARLESNNEEDYAFCSCVVAPGFDFVDFEMANQNQLAAKFPQYSELIHALTRENPVVPLP